MPQIIIALILGCILINFSAFAADEASKDYRITDRSDVRIVVDISGSMKRTDPKNLRVPAVKLLVKLLPNGSQAGIWTYGQWVNMLVPLGEVDETWRNKAVNDIADIRSVGLRTNMGEALEKAAWKLSKDSPYQQSVILLTDGIVDIAPDEDPNQKQKNAAERERILNKIAARYKASGTVIHTIALSSESDIPLMRELALRTGGTHFVAEQAEDLLKVFAKAYERVVPTEQVPIKKNRFSIDSGIREFTALIFRTTGSKPTELIDPKGKRYAQIHQNTQLRWYSDQNFDLVTIVNPLEGEWEIDAELDPDNRIMVVSDLMLGVRNIPKNIAPGDKIDLEAFLHEDGNTITHKEFLKLMTINLTVTQEGGRTGSKVISDPENPPVDGVFHEDLNLRQLGTYELKITLDGKTFERQRTEYVTLRDPLQIEVRAENQGTEAELYQVVIIPYSSNIDTEESKIIAKVSGPESYSIIQAARKNEEGQWQVTVKPIRGPGQYETALNIRGRNKDGTEFNLKPEGIPLGFPIAPDFQTYVVGKPKPTAVEVEKPETEEETEAETAPEDTAEDTREAEEAETTAPELEQIDETSPDDIEAPESVESEAASADETAATEEVAEDAVSDTEETVAEDAESSETEAAETEVVETEEESSYLWLYILFALLTLGIGVGGFFMYRWMLHKEMDKSQGKKAISDDLDDLDDDLEGDDDDLMSVEGEDEDFEEDEEKAAPAAAALTEESSEDDFDEDFDLSTTDDDETISLDNAAPVRPEEGRPREEEPAPAPKPAPEPEPEPEPAKDEPPTNYQVPDDDFDISPETETPESQASTTGVDEEETDVTAPEEASPSEPAPTPGPEPDVPPIESIEEDEMPVEMSGIDEDIPDTDDALDDVDVNELMEELDQELGSQGLDDMDDVDIESLIESSDEDVGDELDDIDVEELMREMEKEEEEDNPKKDN